MRRRRIWLLSAAAVLLVALVVSVALVMSGRSGSGASGRSASPERVTADAGGSPGAAADAVAPGGVAALPAPGVSPVVPLPPQTGRDLVRTARLTVDVADTARVAQAARDVVATAGGLVADEGLRDGVAALTVRVPSDKLDGVLAGLAGLGTVTERSAQAEDVTERMVDLDARVATQRASVARVRALLDRAVTIGEIVEIESELTRREAELESLQGRLAALSSKIALSTVQVQLRAPGALAPQDGFLGGLAAGWDAFVTVTRGLFVGLGAALPFLGLAALVGAGVIVVRRRLRARRQAAATG